MSPSQVEHANKIVEQFQGLLGQEALACISDEHFKELSLLIESAIDASVLDAEEAIAIRLQTVIDDVRKNAEKSS
ncbi:MAG: hypothetical protein ACWA5X_12330 [bacterium]